MIRHLPALGIAVAVTLTLAFASPSSGHDGHVHVAKTKSAATADRKTSTLPADIATALPFPSKIGGDFELIDQTGKTRSLKDFAGEPMLVFFGYANCKAICSVALPRMAEMVDLLEARKISVQPVLITVDPERDTPEMMRKILPEHHRRLVGLTGSREAINNVQNAFQVESKVVYTDPDGEEIFAHGSFIYLMGRDGKFLTLFPPILAPKRMADIVEKYL